MAEQRFGRIIVEGNPAQLALAAKVYAGADPNLPFPGDIEPHDFPIEFQGKAWFLSSGLVIPGTEGKRPKSDANPKGGIAAYGYTLPTKLVINSDTRPRDQAYALEHEPFHPIVAKDMTAAKAVKLRALVEKVVGTPYQNRLSEVLCDAFVELFYGHSILDSYYGDIADADLRNAWDILVAAEQNPVPVPPEPPVPLPLPDPQVAALQAQVAQLMGVLDTIHQLSAPTV